VVCLRRMIRNLCSGSKWTTTIPQWKNAMDEAGGMTDGTGN
jgi:hypothetical protein